MTLTCSGRIANVIDAPALRPFGTAVAIKPKGDSICPPFATLAFDKIHLADELRDKNTGRLGVNLVGRRHLNNFAVMHDADLIAETQRLRLIVRDIKRGHARRPW